MRAVVTPLQYYYRFELYGDNVACPSKMENCGMHFLTLRTSWNLIGLVEYSLAREILKSRPSKRLLTDHHIYYTKLTLFQLRWHCITEESRSPQLHLIYSFMHVSLSIYVNTVTQWFHILEENKSTNDVSLHIYDVMVISSLVQDLFIRELTFARSSVVYRLFEGNFFS